MHPRILLLVVTFLCTSTFSMGQTRRGLSTDQQPLTGTQWTLVSFAQDVGTLQFEGNGHVNGVGACNSYSGNYQVQGDRISFSQIVSTKKACLDTQAMLEELKFLSALRTASRFRLTSKQLAIYYDGGQSILEFKRVNDETANLESGDPVSVLNDYYRSINAGQLRRALSYWETPSQTLEQFTRGFADTMRVRLLVEPSPLIEGAAGSSYANVASIIISTQRDGAERVFAGCYVMRKSNVRDEENPEQKVWRIYRANLAPVAGNIGIVLTQRCKG
jgi:heat shock protein HslJ